MIRSDTDRVLDASATLENLLEKMHGANGKGLHEKATSVAHKLDKEQIKRLRYIASVRNAVVHERVSIDDTRAFDSAVEKAIDALSKECDISTTTFNSTSWNTHGSRQKDQPEFSNSNINLDELIIQLAEFENSKFNKKVIGDAGSLSAFTKDSKDKILTGLVITGSTIGFAIGYYYFGIGAGLVGMVVAALYTAVFGGAILAEPMILVGAVAFPLTLWIIQILWNVKF